MPEHDESPWADLRQMILAALQFGCNAGAVEALIARVEVAR